MAVLVTEVPWMEDELVDGVVVDVPRVAPWLTWVSDSREPETTPDDDVAVEVVVPT
jgi:hypothetical protein